MSTVTANYGWLKPTISGDGSVWGTELNNDLDAIDAQVHSNQLALTGIVPIGSIVDFAGSTAPANWLLCDGGVYAIAGTYNKLYLVIGNTFPGGDGVTTFAVPNCKNQMTIGVGSSYALGATGGAATVTLDATMIPAHTHPITDVTHNHTINQSAHTHVENAHTHTINDPTHAHTYTATIPGYTGIAGGGAVAGTVSTATGAAATGIGINATTPTMQGANANVSLNAVGTGLTGTQSTGGGLAHNNLPPYIALNRVIRYQ